MATKYFMSGGVNNNWNANTNWSTTSSAGPNNTTYATSSDDVIMDSGSPNCVVNVASACKSLTQTGYTGTFSGSYALSLYGNYIAGGTYSSRGVVYFYASASLTSNGKNISTSGIWNAANGITITLQDDLNITGTIYAYYGTWNFNGKTVTCGSISDGGSTYTRTLTLGAATVNCGTFGITSASGTRTINPNSATLNITGLNINSGATWNSSTEVINCSGSGTFAGGGKTYYNVTFTNTGNDQSISITGANTFGTLTITGANYRELSILLGANQTVSGTFTATGYSGGRRILVMSDDRLTQRTLTVNGSVSLSYVLFRDIKAAGSVSRPWTGTELGNLYGNTDITLTTGANMYWHEGTGNWSDAKWYLATNGGGGTGRVPLPQDTAIFDSSSFDSDGSTITIDVSYVPSFDFSGIDQAITLTTSLSYGFLYGTLYKTNGAYITFNYDPTNGCLFYAHDQTVCMYGSSTWGSNGFTVYLSAGVLQFVEDFYSSGGITVYDGSIDCSTYNPDMSINNFMTSDGTDAYTVDMGSGTWSITGWSFAHFSTMCTINAGTSTLLFTGAMAQRLISNSAVVYHNLVLQGTNSLIIQNTAGLTFNNITATNVNKPIAIFDNAIPITVKGDIRISGISPGGAAFVPTSSGVNVTYDPSRRIEIILTKGTAEFKNCKIMGVNVRPMDGRFTALYSDGNVNLGGNLGVKFSYRKNKIHRYAPTAAVGGGTIPLFINHYRKMRAA